MFRKWHSHCLTPAFAGEGLGSQFFASGWGGRRGPFGGEWGDQPRTRRGDMKFILLGVLLERPKHGYEIIKELETHRGGFRRLSPGSVYPTLQLLEESGHLTSEQSDGKRVYSITESGRQLLSDRNQQAKPGDAAHGFAAHKPSELIELRQALTELNDAVTQVARSGNLEQANHVRDLLTQVKREVYKRLAEQ